MALHLAAVVSLVPSPFTTLKPALIVRCVTFLFSSLQIEIASESFRFFPDIAKQYNASALFYGFCLSKICSCACVSFSLATNWKCKSYLAFFQTWRNSIASIFLADALYSSSAITLAHTQLALWSSLIAIIQGAKMQEFRYMIAGRMYSIWEVDEAVLRAGLPPPENGSNLFSNCFTLKAWDRLSLLQLMIHVYNVLLTGRTPVSPMQHLYALLYSMLTCSFFHSFRQALLCGFSRVLLCKSSLPLPWKHLLLHMLQFYPT